MHLGFFAVITKTVAVSAQETVRPRLMNNNIKYTTVVASRTHHPSAIGRMNWGPQKT